jgi:hypothetical protein
MHPGIRALTAAQARADGAEPAGGLVHAAFLP